MKIQSELWCINMVLFCFQSWLSLSEPAPPYDDAWAYRRAAPTTPPSYGWTNLPSWSSRNTNSWIPPRDYRSTRPFYGTPRKTEPVRTETSSSPWLTGGLLAGAGLLGGYLLRGAVSGGTTESTVHTEARNRSRLYPTLTDSETGHSSNNSDDERRHVSTSKFQFNSALCYIVLFGIVRT